MITLGVDVVREPSADKLLGPKKEARTETTKQ